MTAVTSSNENTVRSPKTNSFFMTRFRNDLKHNKKIFILNIVLEILGLPMIAVVGLIYLSYDNRTDIPYKVMEQVEAICTSFVVIGFITTGISLLLGMMFAFSSFSYLYKKSIADMHYALPLSSKQRFAADFLSGFAMYFLPAVGAIILSTAIMGVGSSFVDLKDFWEAYPGILHFAFIILETMLLYYTTTVFALVFCGNVVEATFSFVTLNLAIPGTLACLWLVISQQSNYGVTEEGIFTSNIFTSSSALGSAFFFILFSDEADLSNMRLNSAENMMFLRWVGFTLLFIALYAAAAYFLYKNRKAEDISKPFVYKAFFYIIMTSVVFCCLSIFISAKVFLGAGILVCAIFWFIMELITRRGFKKFWQAGIGFAASVSSVLLICWVCTATNGFGMAKHVPLPSSVSSVSIYCYQLYPEHIINFRDKDVIKAAVALQQDCVDRHFNPENYYNGTELKSSDYANIADITDYDISLDYMLYSGTTMSRSYEFDASMCGDLAKAIFLSDEYARYASNAVVSTYYKSKAEYEQWRVEVYDKYLATAVPYDINEAMAEKLQNAYRADIGNMTEDDLINGKPVCYLSRSYYWVFDTFTNTIDVLNEIGVDFDSMTFEQLADEMKLSIDIDPIIATRGPKLFTNYERYSYDEDPTYYRLDKVTFITNRDKAYNDSITALSPDDPCTKELLDSSSNTIIDEHPLAIIYIGDYNPVRYVRDTPKNRALIEEVTGMHYTGKGVTASSLNAA